MVSPGHIVVENMQRSFARRHQFTAGDRPSTADRQVSRSVGGRHLLNKLHQPETGPGVAVYPLLQVIEVALAALPDDLNPLLVVKGGEVFLNRIVDRPGPTTSSQHQAHRPLITEPELL